MEASKCNLIVNYLPPELDDDDLEEIFADEGIIVRAKVVRDRTTGRSSCYGFVLFANEEDAARAIASKNGMHIGNKRLKVGIARPPRSQESGNCKLYVKDLPPTFTEADVFELFSKYGDVVEHRLLKNNETGESRCTAFIVYSNQEECEEALIAVDGIVPDDAATSISVEHADPNHFELKKFGLKLRTRNSEDSTDGHSISTPSVTGHSPRQHLALASPLVSQGRAVFPGSGSGLSSYFPHPTPIAHHYGTNYKYVLRLFNVPTYASVGHIYNLFLNYGFVLAVAMDMAFGDEGYMCTGRATVELCTTPSMLESAVNALHESTCFEGVPPLQILVE